MPSVLKRKNIRSVESEPSPKKGKFEEASPSPASSPIKGPLQDHTETNSPIFVAKCFYGLKKSKDSEGVKQKTPTKKNPSKVLTPHGVKKKLEHSQLDSVSGRVEQLMLEIIANSPVKQRLYESCSKAEFRKLYSSDYKNLEDQVKRESFRTTRRTSKIVLTKSEESDTDDYESSDNNETTEVSNGALDNESDEENVNDYLQQASKPKTNVPNDSITYVGNNSATEISSKNNKSTTELNNGNRDYEPSTPNNLNKKLSGEQFTSTPTSEKKFFKTRTPVDNSKMYGIVRGKGFDLKVVPKTLQNMFDKRSKKTQQKINHPLRSQKKNSESPKSLASGKASHVTSDSDITSTDSAVGLSPQAGFWFAPGFLSPEKNSDELAPDDEMPNEIESLANDSPSLNKSNKVTYQRTPPKKSILDKPESPAHSTNPSSSDNLLPDKEVPLPVAEGSEDLFSSQNSCASGNAKTDCNIETRATDDDIDKSNAKDEDGSSQNETKQMDGSGSKLFPVFTRRSARLASTPTQSRRSPITRTVIAPSKDPNQEQMFLDAGQKKFGATQCPVCSMVYCHADPEDETAHSKFHKRMLEALKYPGWKKPRVLQEFPDDLGQVIMVLADDPKHMKKKVDEVNQVMARELGFPGNPNSFIHRQQKVFLYVCEKEIAGCCVAEPIKEGYRTLPGDMDTTEISGQRPWRSSDIPEPAYVGINRLWVAASKRKTGVATKLVDCVRQWFDYGTLTPLHRLAFSDPTPDGRMFAQKYMKSNTFLVYKYNT